jgi:hypothetical protein
VPLNCRCEYDPVQEVKDYPKGGAIPGRMSKELSKKTPKQCGICGSTTERLMRTGCCGNWVCDNEHKYEMMSYSRAFCGRSHARYTICGSHTGSGHHCDKPNCPCPRIDPGDCRACNDCFNDTRGEWFGTNGYNFTPSRCPAKGALHTDECSTCKRRVHTGHEGYSTMPDGSVSCNECGGMGF